MRDDDHHPLRFNRLEGDSLIQTLDWVAVRGMIKKCFNRLEGDSLIQTVLDAIAEYTNVMGFQSP